MRITIRLAAVIGLLMGLLAVPLSAQTVLNSTTLAAAMTDTSGTVMSLTSATGFTAPGTGATQVLALVDREVVAIRAINGLIATVTRGQNSTRATPHITGTVVTVGPPPAFYANVPTGGCTRTNVPYVPYIVGGSPGLGSEVGGLFDCLGVGAAGQWTLTNSSGNPVVGSTVASATTITPTGTYFKVSGVVAVATITVPAGWAAGQCLAINPQGVFATTTAGNISVVTTATVVNRILWMCWDGLKWNPSYLS